MKLAIDIDFEGALTNALSQEKLAPMLDKAISEATGYRSEFRKQLTEQIKGALPHGLGLDDMMKFQHALNAVIAAEPPMSWTEGNEAVTLPANFLGDA